MLNNEKITKIIARRYIWLPFLMGVLLGIVCFVVFTGYDRMKIEKIADETLDFMQDRVKKYDDYKNNDKVKSLYRLADKTLELDQRLEEKDADQEELVERYMKDQRLDGVLLIDENLNCVYQAEDVGKMDTFWQEQMSEPAVKNMLEQPRKTYITRLDKEGENYDFAVVSRTDGKGLVAAYIEKEKNMEDNGDISIYSLFTGFTFDMNGIVAVTDDKQVLSSNSEELLSVKPGEYRDIFTPDIYTGDEHRMIHLESTGGSWYGEIKQMKDYTLYAFFPETAIYALRTKVVIGTMGVYILCWMTFMLVRGYVAESNMRQMEKQYHIIQSVSSVFSICMLLDLKKNTWEMIKASDQIRKMTGNETNTANMMKFFCKNTVAQSERQKFWDFVNPDTLAERLQGKDYINCQTEIGKGEWFSIMLVPQHHDAHGNVEAALFLSRNITDEKMREMDYQKKLEKSVEQAEQANIAKTDFLRRMSHDIRTPINGIRGMVDICRYYIGNPKKQEECLDKILLSSTFLMELVNDVLDMNKLESGQIKLEEKPFSISEILKEVETVVGMAATEQGITLTVKKGEINHENLLGSSLHVRQILQNITSNAVKYNKPNGKVILECRELPPKNEKAVFEFVCTDNGIGMSPEFQEHAFEPFVQENSSARTSYTGTGLGLAIVKKLVEQMEGTIHFVSEPGKGTRFTLVIPFLPDVRQILQNITSNAVKYNKPNGKVILECRELPPKNEKAVFEFVCTDNGIGMSPEFQEHAFEPFVQENSSARTSYTGTGLGLAIVKKLVEQMEGTIHFVSEPGKGTRFTLVIPFLPDDSIEMQTEQTQSTDAVKGIENDKILLVEDYEINMEIARFVLENEGAQVQEAWNGKEAVDLFAASEPGGYDVILMDLMMPVMGGLEAAQCIRKLEREDAKTVPIIAMTANAFADDEERSLAAGMDAHISKPLDAEKLIQVISDICKKRKEHAKGDADI